MAGMWSRKPRAVYASLSEGVCRLNVTIESRGRRVEDTINNAESFSSSIASVDQSCDLDLQEQKLEQFLDPMQHMEMNLPV